MLSCVVELSVSCRSLPFHAVFLCQRDSALFCSAIFRASLFLVSGGRLWGAAVQGGFLRGAWADGAVLPEVRILPAAAQGGELPPEQEGAAVVPVEELPPEPEGAAVVQAEKLPPSGERLHSVPAVQFLWQDGDRRFPLCGDGAVPQRSFRRKRQYKGQQLKF